jgi:hypothetical protein
MDVRFPTLCTDRRVLGDLAVYEAPKSARVRERHHRWGIGDILQAVTRMFEDVLPGSCGRARVAGPAARR